jgi:predicted nucleotidyltransferase
MHEALDRLVNSALGELDAVLPPGYSAVLYGSAAREEYVPGVSDLNLLVVTEALDAGHPLRRLSPRWRGCGGNGSRPRC